MSAAKDLFQFEGPIIQDPSLSIFPDETKDKEDLNVEVGSNVFTFDNFKPYNYQAAILRSILERGYIKRGFIILPRRAGKTEIFVLYLLLKSFEKAKTTTMPYLRYGILYPDLGAGKAAVNEKLNQRTLGLPERKFSENLGRVTYMLNGDNRKGIHVTIEIMGLQNMQHRRGRGYDGLIGDEVKDLPEGYESVVNPMISDRSKGDTFLILTGTPEEGGNFWEKYDDYKRIELEGNRQYYTYWSNYDNLKHISEENADMQKLELGSEEWDIEYGCKRGVVTGARIFGQECFTVLEQNRVRDIPVSNGMKWMVADIGSSKRDFFAIWIVQGNQHTGRWESIDYTQIPSATETKVFDWVQERRHKVGQMILPFDGDRGLKPPKKLFQELFPHTDVYVLPKTTIEHRIRAGRLLFPHMDFDRNNCVVGWNCLKNYSRVKDKKKKIYLLDPKHDKYSHGADAYTYFALAAQMGKLKMSFDSYSHNYGLYGKKSHNKVVSDPMNDYINQELMGNNQSFHQNLGRINNA